MNLLSKVQQRFFQRFLDQKQNTFAITVFCKALVVFVIIKIISTWSVSLSISSIQTFIPSPSFVVQILFSIAYWASKNLVVFYSLCLVFLTVTLFVRWNGVIGLLFFLITLNLYRINIPIANGSDLVLFMLAFWSIGMGLRPSVRNEKWNLILVLIFNMAVLFCQFQIVFIYLVSGWDKLMSEVWRSGDAVSYISHLDFFYNKQFGHWENNIVKLVLSWIVITFELSFCVLIWLNRTRKPILLFGFVFHCIIWFTLSLPDFALVMMISYLIFLKDGDYKLIRNLKFSLKKIKIVRTTNRTT